jgi:hypothetical protein
MSRRYRALAEQLTAELGLRGAARRLSVKPTTFADHLRGRSPAKLEDIENAMKKLRLDWDFFTNPALGDAPSYKRFVRGKPGARDHVRQVVEAWAAKMPPELVKNWIETLIETLPPGPVTERTVLSWWQDLVEDEHRGREDLPETDRRGAALQRTQPRRCRRLVSTSGASAGPAWMEPRRAALRRLLHARHPPSADAVADGRRRARRGARRAGRPP